MDIKGLAKRMALATPFAALSTAVVTTSAYAGTLTNLTKDVGDVGGSMGNLMAAVLMVAAIVVAGISLVLLIYNIRQGKDYKKAIGFLVAAIIVFIVAALYGTGSAGFFRTTGDNLGNAKQISDLL